MSEILLDYFFPITTIEPTPAASTAFLKQVAIVVNPNGGGSDGDITECTTYAQVQAITDNTEAEQLFNAGMSRVFVIQSDDLNLSSILNANLAEFFTLLISSDFAQADIVASQATLTLEEVLFTAVTAGWDGNDLSVEFTGGATAGAEVVTVADGKITVQIEDGVSTATQVVNAVNGDDDASALVTASTSSGATAQDVAAEDDLTGGDGLTLGQFAGVVGVSDTDDEWLDDQAVIANRCAFHTTAGNKAKNMFYAFGKLLSNALSWRNQQYITMPLADDVDTLGEATALFDDKISFVLTDSEFGNRLGLFAAGAKAITAPYIKRNLELDLQSAALQYVSGNQPEYTRKHASLIEDELTKVIQESYIDTGLIEDATVEVTLEQDNFVASGSFNISEPKALWRIVGEMRQTL
jgi:hypothetical protein